MAALMTAAREGRAVRNCSLYTTTYPCHECMRLIIGAGIQRVIYIDPYPKSLAAELFDELLGDKPSNEHVHVEPFTGIAPRLFPRVFELSNRAKDLRGEYQDWTDKSLRTTNAEFSSSMIHQERAAAQYLLARRTADAAQLVADEPLPLRSETSEAQADTNRESPPPPTPHQRG